MVRGHERTACARDSRKTTTGVVNARSTETRISAAENVAPLFPCSVARAQRMTMTYYGAKEIAESFRTVRSNTIQVAEDIPEAEYSYRAAPDTMSVGEI